MANVRITRSISGNAAFGKQVENAVAEQTARRLLEVAADAERRTNDIVKAELVNDRSPDRRRHGAHLLGSFRCKVVLGPGGGFPMQLVMTSIAPGGAVNAQESGAKPHKIPGPVVFPVAQRWGGKGAPAGHSPQAQRHAAAYGKNAAGNNRTVEAPFVMHPGNRPIGMMKRGLEAAVQAAYHQALVVRRR